MKRYIKAFIPDFRPSLGPDISFDLLDFQEEDFVCPIEKEEAGIYIILKFPTPSYQLFE